jgi:T5SS/PEP-CTERM-associated repeat protein
MQFTHHQRALALACLLAASPLSASAADDVWTTPTSTTFTSGPWSPAAPGPLDTALFNAAGAYTVTFDTSPTNAAFSVQQGAVTWNADATSQTYTLTGPSSITSGSLTLGAAGGMLIVNAGDLTLDGTAAPSLTAASRSFLNLGNLSIGSSGIFSSSGVLTVRTPTTQAYDASLTVGAAFGSTGRLVISAANFQTGAGLALINRTGQVTTTSSSNFIVNGDLTLNGGSFSGGEFLWAAYHTITIQAGGSFTLDATSANPLLASYITPPHATINITGTGSTFSHLGALPNLPFLHIDYDSTIAVTAGGSLKSNGSFLIGEAAKGTVTVDGTGSTITTKAGQTTIGFGGTGSLTLSNHAIGTLGDFDIGGYRSGASGTLNVLSSATLNTGGIRLAAGAIPSTGTINVTNATLIQSGSTATLAVGSTSLSSATLTVGAGGSFTTPSTDDLFPRVLVHVFPTGTINVQSGGTFNLQGTMAVDPGGVYTNAGTLNASADITNAGTFTQSGAQNWSSPLPWYDPLTFTNNAGTATFLSAPKLGRNTRVSLVVNGGTVSLPSFSGFSKITLTGGTIIVPGSPLGYLPFALGANATFELTASYDFSSLYSADLTGTGLLIIDPGATVTLPIDTAFSGTIQVNGTLVLAPARNPNAATFNFSVLDAPSVPEPASLALLTLGTPLLLRRPGRKRLISR